MSPQMWWSQLEVAHPPPRPFLDQYCTWWWPPITALRLGQPNSWGLAQSCDTCIRIPASSSSGLCVVGQVVQKGFRHWTCL